MKIYLIAIESAQSAHNKLFTTIYGDTPARPFMIAHNLWNYKTPGHAARRLEKLAQSWESGGHTVKRIFGTVADMPTKGSAFNVGKTLIDCNATNKTYRQLLQEHGYHY